MAKFREKIQARALRKQGKSIKDIANILDVSKSSVSMWCRDISLTKRQIEKITKEGVMKNAHGRLLGVETNRKKKRDIVNRAEKDAKDVIGKLNERDLTLLATGLFWGEGSKSGSRFIFVNSDPEMVSVVLKFLTKVLDVKKEDVRLTIQINEIHKSRIEQVISFWVKKLDISRSQVGKTYYVKVKPKKIYKNFDTYYGVARLRVLRSSTIQYKMLGLVKAVCRGSSAG